MAGQARVLRVIHRVWKPGDHRGSCLPCSSSPLRRRPLGRSTAEFRLRQLQQQTTQLLGVLPGQPVAAPGSTSNR
jgi:hypothetical protein